MSVVSLKDAKADLSTYVDNATRGEFVTITRRGKPVAALVPLAAADAARRALATDRPSFAEHLLAFPGGVDLERNRSPSRDVEL